MFTLRGKWEIVYYVDLQNKERKELRNNKY